MKKSVIATCVASALLLNSSSFVDAKKKKKKKKSDNELNDRFLEIERDLYCQGCQALFKEGIHYLHGKRSESDVIDMMSWICDVKYFKNYTYPPDRVLKACQIVMGDFEEQIEQLFMQRDMSLDTELFINKMCFEEINACKNVDVRNLGKPKFFLDGIQQDPGKITMGYGAIPGSQQAEGEDSQEDQATKEKTKKEPKASEPAQKFSDPAEDLNMDMIMIQTEPEDSAYYQQHQNYEASNSTNTEDDWDNVVEAGGLWIEDL